MKGTYRYWMNRTQTDIIETFRVISTSKADTVIESERHAPAFNSRIAAKASYKNGHIHHFEIEWENSSADAVQFANAHYQFTENEILVSRDIDGGHFLETLPRPEIFTVYPILRVFTGRAIRETYELGRGIRVPVLVPNIKDPNDKVQLLALELDMRFATVITQDKVSIDNKDHQTQIYRFTGGRYDETAKFWVDENDILLKYEWQQNPDLFWEVKLVEIN
ncbi:MAG: hypothetical protein R3307_03920 [Anaerolineales bacterium]|nr:hypothetical protein [Anaerolineales bacterium]